MWESLNYLQIGVDIPIKGDYSRVMVIESVAKQPNKEP